MTDFKKLADLDDKISGTDQEDLDTIFDLVEQRSVLLEEPLPEIKLEEPPTPEPQEEAPTADDFQVDPEEEDKDDSEDDSKDEETEEDRTKRLSDEYTVGQLKKILKEAGIKGYSKLREAELIQLIIESNIEAQSDCIID